MTKIWYRCPSCDKVRIAEFKGIPQPGKRLCVPIVHDKCAVELRVEVVVATKSRMRTWMAALLKRKKK